MRSVSATRIFYRESLRGTLLGVAGIALSLSACTPTVQMTSETRMGELVDACSAEQANQRAPNCDQMFTNVRLLLYTAFDSESDAPVCGPDPQRSIDSFRDQVVKWVKMHPEYRSMTWGSAVRPLALHAFACPKVKAP